MKNIIENFLASLVIAFIVGLFVYSMYSAQQEAKRKFKQDFLIIQLKECETIKCKNNIIEELNKVM